MGAVLVVLVLCLLIIAAVVVVGMGIQSRRQIRETEHRERLAMIERGLPPPAVGLAYFFLVSFAVRNPEIGIGVGCVFTVIGAAFCVNALMLHESARIPPRRAEPSTPSNTRDS